MGILNDRIKERRTKLNMTLLEVAEALDVKEATVQRYESGEIKNIKHETVGKLAQIFHCSPGYLMGWEEEPEHINNYDMVAEETGQYGKNVAAHRESEEDWSPEELKKIDEYKQLLLAARKNTKRP